MYRRRTAGWVAAGAVWLVSLSGCGFIWTYDDAFPPEPLDFPRWDPPDSMAVIEPMKPPPVESVVYEKDLWEQLHPPGEAEAMLQAAIKRQRRMREEEMARRRAREEAQVSEAVGDTLAAETESLAALEARADSAAADSAAMDFHPPPPIVVDLTARQIDLLSRRARVDIDHARSNLQVLQGEVPASSPKQEQIQAVRGFIRLAEKALTVEDYQGAANLAIKARTLAESLVADLPDR